MTETSDQRPAQTNPLQRAAQLAPRVPRIFHARRAIATDVFEVLRSRTRADGSEPDPPQGYGDFQPGHYHSPIPSAAQIEQRLARLGERAADVAGVDLRVDHELETLQRLSPLLTDSPFGTGSTEAAQRGHRYYSGNPFFGTVDGLLLHAMLRAEPPRQVVEVGSGFSSAVMLDTDDLFLDHSTRFTFIEPYPQRLHGLLRAQDREGKRVCIHEQAVQDVPREIFTGLDAGDMLFIDSSHVASCGSDVQYLLLDILPRLRSGVRVHIHDIPWPFEYSADWLSGGRYWNEAYFVNALLIGNEQLQIDLFAAYIWDAHRELLRELAPRWFDAIDGGGSSLWLRVA